LHKKHENQGFAALAAKDWLVEVKHKADVSLMCRPLTKITTNPKATPPNNSNPDQRFDSRIVLLSAELKPISKIFAFVFPWSFAPLHLPAIPLPSRFHLHQISTLSA